MVSAAVELRAEWMREVHPRVAVVINTYNQAHYLGDAIESVLAQSRPADEILVVDDGSSDQPQHVLKRYLGVAYIRQENQGLAASRNTGLAATTAEMVVFLDADDRLLPEALASGLACHQRTPACAFTYGSYRNIASNGEVLGPPPHYSAAGEHSYLDLLRFNTIGMHAAVMYRREALVRCGGFDVGLRRCEDYDVYLKIARTQRIASHSVVIAEYRRHEANMSHDHRGMLAAALSILDRQEPYLRPASGERRALIQGRRTWKRYFAREVFLFSLATRRGDLLRFPKATVAALRLASIEGAVAVLSVARSYARKRLPPSAMQFLKRLKGAVPFGRFNFGDFARTRPVSGEFGFDRGQPIDRYYIEAFLARQSADIKGRTLEIGDDSYTRQFGGSRVRQADVLHVNADNPHATIVGDLSAPGTLPEAAFDCLVLTQTLHLIYDMRAAVAEMHRTLKPGGVVLLTVPGISQIDRGEWGNTWYWALTPAAARRLFADTFGPENVRVESHGNVYAATTFLQGLAFEEVDRGKLDVEDPAYPVVVTVRAQKQA